MFDCEGRTDCCLMLLFYRNCPTPSLSRRRESVGELTLLLTVLVSNVLISCVANKNDVVFSEPSHRGVALVPDCGFFKPGS